MSSHLNEQRIQHMVETNYIHVTSAEKQHLEYCSLCQDKLDTYTALFNLNERPISFSNDFEQRIMQDITRIVQTRNRKIRHALFTIVNLILIFLISIGYVYMAEFKFKSLAILDMTINAFSRLLALDILSHAFVSNTLSGIAALGFLILLDRLLFVRLVRKTI